MTKRMTSDVSYPVGMIVAPILFILIVYYRIWDMMNVFCQFGFAIGLALLFLMGSYSKGKKIVVKRIRRKQRRGSVDENI